MSQLKDISTALILFLSVIKSLLSAVYLLYYMYLLFNLKGGLNNEVSIK